MMKSRKCIIGEEQRVIIVEVLPCGDLQRKEDSEMSGFGRFGRKP